MATKAAYTLEAVRKLKRLQGILGPDFYGCCNTGSQPLIFRAERGQNWQWIVVAWDLDIRAAQLANWPLANKKKRVLPVPGIKDKRRKMWYFRTSASAFKHWMKLVEARKAENQRMVDEARAAREALRTSKPGSVEYTEAALKLGDLGVM